MSKSIIFTIIILMFDNLFLSNSIAQMPLRFGVYGGVNIANKISSSEEENNRIGIVVGGIIEYNISKIWNIQVEPRYVQKGSKHEYIFVMTDPVSPEATFIKSNVIEKLDYLEFPFLTKAKFDLGELAPFVLIGFSIGYNLIAREVGEDEELFPTIDLKDQYSKFDFSLTGGGGLEIEISNKLSVFADFRYQHGLINIIKESSSYKTSLYGYQIHLGTLINF